jgi:hypothetical protein
MTDQALAEALEKLVVRVENAAGPDRRLDALIHIALNPDEQAIVGHEPGRFPQKAIYGPTASFIPWLERAARLDVEAIADTVKAAHVTSSLDAAMSLLSKGSEYDVTNLYGVARAHVGMNDEDGGHHGEHLGGNVTIALLAAALRVLASQHLHKGAK